MNSISFCMALAFIVVTQKFLNRFILYRGSVISSGGSRWSAAESDLTHWGRVTHICVSKLTIIGSDNGLSPGRRQAIIWTNAGILSIGPLGTNFNETLIEIQTFSLKKIRLKISSAKRRPFSLGINVSSIATQAAVYIAILSTQIVIYLIY